MPREEQASMKSTERGHKTSSEVRTERSHTTRRETVQMRTKHPAKESGSRTHYEKTRTKNPPSSDVHSAPAGTKDKEQPTGQQPFTHIGAVSHETD